MAGNLVFLISEACPTHTYPRTHPVLFCAVCSAGLHFDCEQVFLEPDIYLKVCNLRIDDPRVQEAYEVECQVLCIGGGYVSGERRSLLSA